MKQAINKRYSFFSYAFLNILDKLLVFLMPFIVLFLFNNSALYNDIEYIFSLSAFFLIFMDLGLKNYIFYGYKVNSKKSKFINNFRKIFNLLFLIESTIFLFISILFLFIYHADIYIFVLLRSLYMLLIGFYTNYCRLVDKPDTIYKYSILINISIYLLLGIAYIFNININLFYIFIVYFFTIVLISWKWKYLFSKIHFLLLFEGIKHSFTYVLPIILNLLMMITINNYGKIYAYNMLSDNDMLQISIIQRLSMILILAHGAFLGFYSKKLFISTEFEVHKKIFFRYLLVLFIITIFLILFIAMNSFINFYHIDNLIFILFLMATLCWAFLAYFELYFNRINRNKFIPIITIFIFLSYFFQFMEVGNINLFKLAFIYFISMLVGLLATIYFIYKTRSMHFAI